MQRRERGVRIQSDGKPTMSTYILTLTTLLLSNLFVSLAQHMRVETDTFGSSNSAGVKGFEAVRKGNDE